MSGAFHIFIEQTTDEHLAVCKALCAAWSLWRKGTRIQSPSSQAGKGTGLLKGTAGTGEVNDVGHEALVLYMEAGHRAS